MAKKKKLPCQKKVLAMAKKSFSHAKKIGHVGGVPNKLGSGVPL